MKKQSYGTPVINRVVPLRPEAVLLGASIVNQTSASSEGQSVGDNFIWGDGSGSDDFNHSWQ